MKFKSALIIIALLPSLSFAKKRTEEESRCFAKQSIADEHEKWKADLIRVSELEEKTAEDKKDKYVILHRLFEIILKRTNKLKERESIKPDQQIIDAVDEFISNGEIKQENSLTEIKTLLNKLSNNLDRMLKIAEKMDSKCTLKKPANSDKRTEYRNPPGAS